MDKVLTTIANGVLDVSPVLRETCLGAKGLFKHLAYVQSLPRHENRVALVFDVPQLPYINIVILNTPLNAKKVVSSLQKELHALVYVRVAAAAYLAVKKWHDRYRIPRITHARSTTYDYYLTVSKPTPNYISWSVRHGDAFRAYFASTKPCRFVEVHPSAPENVLNVSDFISGLTTYGEFRV